MHNIHPIQDVNDPFLLPWLELYETSFPFNERLLISQVLRNLRPFQPYSNTHLWSLIDDSKNLAGLMMFHIYPQIETGFGYYFAIKAELRSQGLGALFYQQAISALFKEVKLFVFEVERPELAADAAIRQWAERRIKFYQRQGARLLQGIDYYQKIGLHSAPTPMHLMFHVHPQSSLTPQAAFDAVAHIFCDSLTQTDTLTWA